MRIIAVDDEQFALQDLRQAIEEAVPDCELSCFDAPAEALRHASEAAVDIAFLDISLGGMNGIALAKRLKDINGRTNIIFATGYSDYAVDAFSLHASDYLLKPVTRDAVVKTMEHLREPLKAKSDKRVKVQTFGNFAVFVDGSPLNFTRSKTKELLAYLVNRRGAFCGNDEIIAAIWEDKTDSEALKSHYRHLVADLTQTLKCEGIESMLVKKHGYLAVAPDAFQCDIYDFYNGKTDAINSYAGEYMAQYSWAEFINGYLEDML
ncbi:MAG: response regulator [Clostridiales bacterium]|nr:response regulator [Clostridiales bacterium]